jgi:hypothetical protein
MRQSPGARQVDHFPSRRVMRVLERSIADNGKPQSNRCDNGRANARSSPTFESKLLNYSMRLYCEYLNLVSREFISSKDRC